MDPKLENRSLDRGIKILLALSDLGAATLADLHRQTGLSKSTLRRLMATLLKNRLIRKSISDKKFRLNLALPVTISQELTPSAAFLIDKANPVLEDLTDEIGWPADLHVRDGERMRVIESTRPLSPYFMHKGQVDLHVSIFGSAAGRVVLSTLSNDAIRVLALRTKDDPNWGPDRFYPNVETLIGQIETVRKNGYAARREGYMGESAPNDNLQAIALPIEWRGRAMGATTVIWNKNFQSVEKFAAENLDALRRAVARINASLAAKKEEPVL